MDKKEENKVLSVIKEIFTWTILVVALLSTITTVVLVSSSNQNGYQIFKSRFYIARTDSMSATDFSAGDLVICKKVNKEDLKEGDIITFVSKSVKNYGQTITHKIRKITQDVNGERAFVTYGTTTNTDDEALATEVLGKYVGKIKGVGKFIVFSKTPLGYILLIFLPFSILITVQAINCVKLLKESETNENAKS